jgi:GTP-binding protein
LKKKRCQPRDYEEKIREELMPFTDAYSFCFCITKQRLLKALEATVKVF